MNLPKGTGLKSLSQSKKRESESKHPKAGQILNHIVRPTFAPRNSTTQIYHDLIYTPILPQNKQ